MDQEATVKKEPAWEEVEENAAVDSEVKGRNVLMTGEADVGDVLCMKLKKEKDWKKEEEYVDDEVDDSQENVSGISIISQSLFCKEETILEVPQGTSNENISSVKVEDGMEVDNEEEEQLKTNDNMVREADIGDVLSVKLEKEELWEKEEEYYDANLENKVSGEAGVEDPLDGKLETENWMKEEAFDDNDECKECSENEDLDPSLVETDSEEADSDDDTGFSIKKTAHVDPLKLFDCTRCQKSFIHKGSLIEHMQVHTEEEKPFKCTKCQKSFRVKRYLTKHMRLHRSQKPFKCTECAKSFTQRHDLKKHMRVHTAEKPFHCTVCQKSFRVKAHFTNHMRIHTREKPFNCTECGKSFREKGTFITHMRVHTGEKPFHCTVCQKSFIQKGNLTRHMRVHTFEKPFYCTMCQKSFTQKVSLMEHMRVHTGEKPFHCSYCEKSFPRKGSLVRHTTAYR